ncbi:MAG: hypothetical protein ABI844_16990 [Saprospiraceae bacterium]
MKYVPLYILFCISLASKAQNSFVARVDSTSMSFGDQQNLTLTYITALNGASPIFNTVNLDTCTFFEIVSQSQWIKTQSATNTTIVKKIRFSIYEAGIFRIPSLSAVAGADTLYTYTIPVEVSGIQPDSTGLRPIKGIIEEKKEWTDYLGWILAIIAVAIGFGIYKYIQYQKSKKSEEVIVPVEIIKQPYEIALEKLGALKESRLWEKGEIKDYHSRLTHIFREYLENQYHIPALESTSIEILRDVKLHIHDEELLKSADDILNIADWVKFAKGIPEESANALALGKAIELVLITKSDPLSNESIMAN